MLSAIQSGTNSPSGTPGTLFTFIVNCTATPDCGAGTLAVTDALPASNTFTPTVRLCPLFFNSNTPQTQNNLASKQIIQNPKRNQISWCQPGQPFSFFETAGHTMLHEMTHLDSLGSESNCLGQRSYKSI